MTIVRSLLSKISGKSTLQENKAIPLTFYTRKNCGCCAKAMDVIEAVRRRGKHALTVQAIDIDDDPELVEQYGTWVPVVAIDGKVRFKGQVNPHLLERLLRAEARRR